MQLGMIGLGRMGAAMTRRLMRGGHTLVVYNRARVRAGMVHAATLTRTDDGRTTLTCAASELPDLTEAWAGWHTISRPMRKDYQRFVELTSEGSKELGEVGTGLRQVVNVKGT